MLAEEVFGVPPLVVRCRTRAEVARILREPVGRPIATLHLSPNDVGSTDYQAGRGGSLT